ncbi:M14 family zinc carboxypeptidase [Caldalkalibacillus salinus]|uniref:M14 family zinc carboxypeptidase n=1 Tax=Caldalkalibacillus salinus TaxID=2803787 RepID=UPI001923FC71|nr:M14 family zinc carboxypeptidase [Caldalkalibacillus salinus]
MKKQVIASMLAIGLASTASLPSVVAEQGQAPNQQPSWKYVNINEEEADRSPFNSEHYDFVKYSEIEEKLKQYAQSPRVQLEERGTSSEGRPMYVVTISEPSENGRLGKHKALRQQMFNNPEKAQDWVDANPDFKVPVMINGSIHGTEFVGTDAVLQLIERFAFNDDVETTNILEDNILIFNVVANPDGRVMATRFNGNGIDLNRDFITQSQPETQQMVDLITEWQPMVFLDLHGYVDYSDWYPGQLGLIEPCTPPHNPNYQYDLFIKWAEDQAEAMESEIVSHRDAYESQDYQEMTGSYIPYRDGSSGWDDYPPIFTPMYAMYHGAYGYTLEAPTNDWDGVRWTYDATMGALKFATENKQDMLVDQIEMFKRGIQFDHPSHPEGFFPEAYVLPVDDADPTVTHKAVKHLIRNDIQVERAVQSFEAGGQTYPQGTYVVSLQQAKAGLINTMLWEGEDISDDAPSMYDISSWSLPLLWGFDAIPIQTSFDVKTSPVQQVQEKGALEGKGPYMIPNDSVASVQLVNDLLMQGIDVYKDDKGQFYVEAERGSSLQQAVSEAGLRLQTTELPEDVNRLETLRVAILEDGGMNKQQTHAGTRLALERLGFSVAELHPREVANGILSEFDVFVYSGTSQLISTNLSEANAPFGLENEQQFEAFKDNVHTFVQDGGQYIAVGALATHATAQLDLTDVSYSLGQANSNGIVHLDIEDDILSSGYNAEDIGFVYRPIWFNDVEQSDVTIVARYADQENFFASGHWRNREAAQGQPVVVKHNDQDVTLIGLEPSFRDHTDYLYRWLSNAIFH